VTKCVLFVVVTKNIINFSDINKHQATYPWNRIKSNQIKIEDYIYFTGRMYESSLVKSSLQTAVNVDGNKSSEERSCLVNSLQRAKVSWRKSAKERTFTSAH